MAVTMNEVAKQLNISVATVSRALSGHAEAVSEDTRRAIFTYVETHGYLKRKSVGTNVAFVIDKASFELSSQFYARIISGIEQELLRHKYYFQFKSVERDSFDLARINLDFGRLAGVIMVGVYHDDFVLKLRRLEVPMILIDYYIPTEDIPAVLIDNTDGILKACRHLSSLGHRRIGYLSGDSMETAANERLFGFQRAVSAFGLDRDPALVVENCKSRIDEGFRAMRTLMERRDPPSAVVAYNDLIAVGAMDAIKQAGLSVPADVSVMGFDDIPLAAEVNPPLSTIHVPKETMGTIAARRLVDIIKRKEDIPHKILIPARLLVRSSTAEARVT
jgi:LacI family transcriptional regulator